MFENPSYRDNLAETLKEAPKDERGDILNDARSDAEYWQERVKKLEQRAEFSEDRTELTWDQKRVYHGTTEREIGEFDYAEESTIGDNAVYFTADPELAMGYARLRSEERDSDDTYLYEANLENVRMQNWLQQASVDILKSKLNEYAKNTLSKFGDEEFEDLKKKYDFAVSKDLLKKSLEKIIEKTNEGSDLSVGEMKLVAQGVHGIFFQEFVEQSGFDGVLVVEGGDDATHTVKPGISVVVYNRDKITHHKPYDIAKSE